MPLVIREGRVAEFVLSAGQSALFILEGDEDAPHAIDPHRVSEEFKATLNFWQSWIAQSTYRGRWREIVDRSALVLKLLVSQSHGSIVAAPTFGLPGPPALDEIGTTVIPGFEMPVLHYTP
jgi:GH15 family glucan-1,4-alpha-glucosidase